MTASPPRVEPPGGAHAKCVYRLGCALLLAMSVATTPASAEPARWLGLTLDVPSLAQSTYVISPSLLVLVPKPASAPWPDYPTSISRLGVSSELVSPTDAQLAALMARRPTLEYTPTDSSVTLSLEPGFPCTGACLKLVGSF